MSISSNARLFAGICYTLRPRRGWWQYRSKLEGTGFEKAWMGYAVCKELTFSYLILLRIV